MQPAQRSIALIGAPSSAGAYAPGQEKAPEAFRRHGLRQRLEALMPVVDLGDVGGFRWRPDPGRPQAMNLNEVARVAREVGELVRPALSDGHQLLVLGGDCTVELGTVAAATADQASVGLVYVDLDSDLNPPAHSDGALDWTGVAHLLDLPGCEPELTGLGARRPMLPAANILYFGVANVTPPERRTIDQLNIAVTSLDDVKRDPAAAGDRASEWGARFDRLLVHLDVDVLSFADFPIAENVRRCAGLTLDELAAGLGPIMVSANWRALTITEVNPDHAPDEAASFAALIDMICGLVPGPRGKPNEAAAIEHAL